MSLKIPSSGYPHPLNCGLMFPLLLCLCVSLPLAAQNRPLTSADAETVPAGTLRAAVGFDFLEDANFPLSGLSGNLTSLGVTDLRLGVGQIVEVQLEGVVQNFLDVRRQVGGAFTPSLTDPNSTHDTGNFSLWTKVHILSESGRHPAVAFRFGFEMPNSKQDKGIGTNTTNVYASVILQKHFWRLNLFGDAGLGILQSPNVRFSQNDVLIYGGAFVYPVMHWINLAGEVAGRYSLRTINVDLLGTESHSQGRLGLQIFAGGFQWDVAGIAGITKNDPSSGFTFGVSRDVRLFHLPAPK